MFTNLCTHTFKKLISWPAFSYPMQVDVFHNSHIRSEHSLNHTPLTAAVLPTPDTPLTAARSYRRRARVRQFHFETCRHYWSCFLHHQPIIVFARVRLRVMRVIMIKPQDGIADPDPADPNTASRLITNLHPLRRACTRRSTQTSRCGLCLCPPGGAGSGAAQKKRVPVQFWGRSRGRPRRKVGGCGRSGVEGGVRRRQQRLIMIRQVRISTSSSNGANGGGSSRFRFRPFRRRRVREAAQALLLSRPIRERRGGRRRRRRG